MSCGYYSRSGEPLIDHAHDPQVDEQLDDDDDEAEINAILSGSGGAIER